MFVGFLCLPLFCQLEVLGRPCQPNDPIPVCDGVYLVQSHHVLTELAAGLEGLAALQLVKGAT